MRSRTGLFMRSAERRICAMPTSLPLVHTFVARKTRGRNPNSGTRSPTTVSALPYIGDESIMRPPASTNSRNTSLSGARAAALSPKSKACQVPSPMTGIASPVDGIGRVIIPDAAMTFVLVNTGTDAAPLAPLMKRRRVVLDLGVIASGAKQSRAKCAFGARLLRRFAPRNDELIWRGAVEAEHELQILHRRARGALAEIIEARHQHGLMPRLVGVDREFERVRVVERLRFELAARHRLYHPDIFAAAVSRRK